LEEETMIALLSVMTSFALIVLCLGLVWTTVRGSGAKILAALVGRAPSAEIIAFVPRPRSIPRVTAPPFQSMPPLRAAA
jgi:hypothetical protein